MSMDSEEREFIDTSLTAKPGEAIFDLVDPDPVGEGERWRVLRDDEKYGPGVRSIRVFAEGARPHPPPPEPDSILVPESRATDAEAELARALDERDEADNRYQAAMAERDRLREALGEKSESLLATAEAVVIERSDTKAGKYLQGYRTGFQEAAFQIRSALTTGTDDG